MTVLALIAVTGLTFAGLVLHRALAGWLLAVNSDQKFERELLLQGVLPGLVIVGTIGLYLAVFGLFRLEVFAAVLVAALIWRRRDAAATCRSIAALGRDVGRALVASDIATICATLLALSLFGAYLLNAHFPFISADVIVFQLPLSRSMIEHHGFVYPQIGHLFYSYNPLFFNLLFAEAMLFADSMVTPGILNIFIYFGFVAALTTFVPRYRTMAFIFGLLLTGYSSFFSSLLAAPLVDIPRCCFGVMGLLFGYRYITHERVYDIVIAGLLLGAAIGGHYVELVTLTVLVVHLAPRLWRGRTIWIHAGVFTATLLIVAGYWYFRNWILLGNPIWPFLFGHQGVTDEWLADFLYESMVPGRFRADEYLQATPFARWLGFISSLGSWLLSHWIMLLLALTVIGTVLAFLIAARDRVLILIWWLVVMTAAWVVFLRLPRWGMPAVLLMCCTIIIAGGALWDRYSHVLLSAADTVRRKLGQVPFNSAVGAVVLLLAVGVIRFGHLPTWFDLQLARTVLTGGNIGQYLARKEPGYLIYRYIADRDLRYVLQPFDEEGSIRASAFNDGRYGDWFLPYLQLPESSSALSAFVQQNKVAFFIDQPVPLTANPVRDKKHLGLAREIVAQLKVRATPLLHDSFGWTLYAVEPPAKS